MTTEEEQLALSCAKAAIDKKAEDVRVLDLRGISGFTDFFVICSASSEPQLKAIGSGIREVARQECGRTPLNADGNPASQWIAIDYGGVIAHIFLGDKRDFYGLETLWRDARNVPLPA